MRQSGGPRRMRTLERPVGQRKHRAPNVRGPSHQGRVLGIPPGENPPDGPRLQYVGMQIGPRIGHHQKQPPDRRESENQQRDAPALLDAVEPNEEGTTPACGRRVGARRLRGQKEIERPRHYI